MDPTILWHYGVARGRTYALGSGEDAAALVAEARDVATRAVAEGPELGAPHFALASIELYTGDPLVAMRELRKALELSPTMPEVQELYGRTLIELGQPDRGIDHLRATLKLDPTLGQVEYEIARVRALGGDYAPIEAMVMPTDPTLLNGYWVVRMRTLLWRGDVAKAAELRPAVEAQRFGMKDVVPKILALVATKRIGDDLAAELATIITTTRTRRRRAFFNQVRAEAAAYAGDREAALRALEEAASFGLFDVFWLERCPVLDGLRAEPRYVAVKDRVASRARELLAALAPTAEKSP
jgi:serine/threonine-protein kinase